MPRIVFPTPSLSTTLRSSLLGMLSWAVFCGTPVGAAEPVSELHLVDMALTGELGRARAEADGRAVDAAHALRRRPTNPVLDLRRDQANGPAGASTEVVGAAWTIGLGLPALASQHAAEQRGAAVRSTVQARRVDTICAVRAAALETWRTGERARVVLHAHERLEGVVQTVAALANVGDLSQHEQARAALALAAHEAAREEAFSDARTATARLEAWTGQPLASGGVSLLPLAVLPDEDALVARAVEQAPGVVVLRAQRAAVEGEQAAARRAALPDLTVAGGRRWDAMPDGSARTPGFEVGAALALPIFDRNQAERAELSHQLAELDAALARERALVEPQVRAWWATAAAVSVPLPAVEANALWQDAVDRTVAGEASLESLLGLARDLEVAAVSRLDAEARQRAAHLSLSCAVGAFPHPELQALLVAAPTEVSR